MIGGSGGMPPQKVLKIRCSEVHLWTLSSEIEHRKVVKKLIFEGAIILFAGSVCNSMPSIVGGSGGMLPQKVLKIRCSEVHFGTLSCEIEQIKVVKKLIFKGPIFSLQGQLMLPYIYMPKSFEKIRSNLFAVIHFQKLEGIYALRCIIRAILQAKLVISFLKCVIEENY